MITQINSSEINGSNRLTSVLLNQIKHINDIPANPIFDINIIMRHIIPTIEIEIFRDQQ